jgi:hypothetical protein
MRTTCRRVCLLAVVAMGVPQASLAWGNRDTHLRLTDAAVARYAELSESVMESFEVDYLPEGVAIVRIRRSDVPGLSFPVHLVRAEDGTWQIFDY